MKNMKQPYKVIMTLQIRHIESKSVVRTSETELVEYIDGEDMMDAFNKALKMKAGIVAEIAEAYLDEVSITLDAVARFIPK